MELQRQKKQKEHQLLRQQHQHAHLSETSLSSSTLHRPGHAEAFAPLPPPPSLPPEAPLAPQPPSSTARSPSPNSLTPSTAIQPDRLEDSACHRPLSASAAPSFSTSAGSNGPSHDRVMAGSGAECARTLSTQGTLHTAEDGSVTQAAVGAPETHEGEREEECTSAEKTPKPMAGKAQEAGDNAATAAPGPGTDAAAASSAQRGSPASPASPEGTLSGRPADESRVAAAEAVRTALREGRRGVWELCVRRVGALLGAPPVKAASSQAFVDVRRRGWFWELTRDTVVK